MKNRLESYIEKNRELLDVEIPDDDLTWENISTGISKRRKIQLRIIRFAAVILVLFTAGMAGYYVLSHRQTSPEEITLAAISSDLAEEEKLFRFAVSEKLNDVNRHDADPVLLGELYRELHQIDIQYASYYTDLQEFGSKPKIIHGMIRCYQQKIKILERTLCEIEKSERHENKIKSL
jgi:hypothetical protein